MNRIPLLLIPFLVCLLPGYATGQEEWSLQDCINYALENNIRVKQQELDTRYSQNQLSQAKSNRLPNLNGGFSNNYNFGRSLTYENTFRNVNSRQVDGYLSTGITLWDGFTLSNTIEKKRLDLQAALEELKKTKDNITLNIAAAYLEILFAEELYQVTEDQIGVTRQQIERTEQLVDAGKLALGTLLEMEAQLAREEFQLTNDQNRIQLAYLNLYQLLELPEEEQFKIKKPELPGITDIPSPDLSSKIYQHALDIRPEIKAARLYTESAGKQLEIARGERYPRLSFGADYYNLYNNKYTDIDGNTISFRDQLRNNQRYAMVFSLEIPLFNRFQTENAIANAKLEMTGVQYALQAAKNELRKEIEQAAMKADAAYKQYVSGEKAVKSMQEAFRHTEEKFNMGMVTAIEYNQGKNNLDAARSALLQAKYEYTFRKKILGFYKGTPITF